MQRVNAPIVADKFLHLKHLDIYMGDDDDEAANHIYDYLSLISFLYASPSLESFILSVSYCFVLIFQMYLISAVEPFNLNYNDADPLQVDLDDMKHDVVFGDASTIRQVPRHRHDKLKKVQVNGFFSAKSMFELICHIIEIATSLKSLTLDCIYGEEAGSDTLRCSASRSGECWRKNKRMVLEAHKALSVVRRYIVGRVPSTVELNVRGPCSRCHALDGVLL